MKGRLLFAALAGCLVVGTLAILLTPRDPLSAVFLGCRQSGGESQAEVTVRNISSATVHCYCHLASGRLGPEQCHEVRRPFGLTLDRKATADLAVTVPRGVGPVCVSCEVMFVGRHCSIVRAIGTLLQQAGIYIYHGASAAAPRLQGVVLPNFPQPYYARGIVSNLKLQISGTKPADSLSDYLVFQCFTNSWTVP